MTQTPAGWFPDPENATLLRYWDGTAWTEHRAPRGPTTTDQLSRTGADLADGVARGFTAIGNWVNQNATPVAPATPTFASVAASCRDEPARQPLSVTSHLLLAAGDFAGVAQLFAQAQTAIVPAGATLANQHARLVPNPWNPADPHGVAVFVGTISVGRLLPAVEPTYCPLLAPLASTGLLATCTADLWAQGPGTISSAGVTVHLPETTAFA